MATRNARYWRRFLHDLLQSGPAPDASYDGVCFFSLSGRVEFRDGCFRASSARALAVEPLQLLSLFEQLTRQAVQEEKQQQQPKADKRPTQSLTAALRLGGDCVFHVVSASFSSVCALSSGRARGLVAEAPVRRAGRGLLGAAQSADGLRPRGSRVRRAQGLTALSLF